MCPRSTASRRLNEGLKSDGPPPVCLRSTFERPKTELSLVISVVYVKSLHNTYYQKLAIKGRHINRLAVACQPWVLVGVRSAADRPPPGSDRRGVACFFWKARKGKGGSDSHAPGIP